MNPGSAVLTSFALYGGAVLGLWYVMRTGAIWEAALPVLLLLHFTRFHAPGAFMTILVLAGMGLNSPDVPHWMVFLLSFALAAGVVIRHEGAKLPESLEQRGNRAGYVLPFAYVLLVMATVLGAALFDLHPVAVVAVVSASFMVTSRFMRTRPYLGLSIMGGMSVLLLTYALLT